LPEIIEFSRYTSTYSSAKFEYLTQQYILLCFPDFSIANGSSLSMKKTAILQTNLFCCKQCHLKTLSKMV